MGTVFQVPWTFFAENPAKSSGDPLGQRYEKDESWPEKGMNILKELGFKTVAMALRDDSISLTGFAAFLNAGLPYFRKAHEELPAAPRLFSIVVQFHIY